VTRGPSNQVVIFAIILSALLLLVLVDFYGSSAAQKGLSLSAYENKNLAISLNYPSNWKIEEIASDNNATYTNSIVKFQPDSNDGFNNIVSVELDDISNLTDRSIQGVKEFEEGYILLGDTASIEISEGTQVSGYPAQKIIYTEDTAEDQRQWNWI
jgi:hypothetical protein